MTLICFASQKGSPGATATALAVAASLKVADGRRKVLLEADATGGTLAIRYRLPVEPGLLTLAAAVRGGLDSSDALWRHAQELPGGLPVIVCPDGPEQVHAAMAAGGAQLGRFLNNLRDVDVMCDVGRLAPDSPALPFVAEASAVLMVARPTAEQLQPAARRMLMLRPLVSNLGWVLVGQKPYGPADVEATYEFPVVGVMADDPRSVLSLERGTVSKRLRRQPFIRSATTLAETLSGWLSPLTNGAQSAVAEARPQEVSKTQQQKSLEPAALEPDKDKTPSVVEVPSPAVEPIDDAERAPSRFVTSAELAALPAPNPPADFDLSLLPPPTGEPDLSTPSPELDRADPVEKSLVAEPGAVPDPIVSDPTDDDPANDDSGDDDLANDDSGVAEIEIDNVADAEDEPENDLVADLDESWDLADDENVGVGPAPTLASAPLLPPPSSAQNGATGFPDPDLDPETLIFPVDELRPEAPPPAPVGSRGVPQVDAEAEPAVADLAALAEPTGLGWADLESVAPAVTPPMLPLDGVPPVPPPSLSIEPQSIESPSTEPSSAELLSSPSAEASPEPGTPPAPPPSLSLENQVEDSWDGSEFSVTADLTQVFAAPDFDAPAIEPERKEPPMPPMAAVPPLPPPSTQLDKDQNGDRGQPPTPFPHEESGADWNGW